ncbi:hypothetical protein [Streptacidiphilus carbonis]|uniref:hypothetical protein n=1 Tax=Streptacidiphilus carbonis TaxID=105422 RepID=UPI0005A821E2|nr:hypothetical protein [Streptacidiphilus carbonis]
MDRWTTERQYGRYEDGYRALVDDECATCHGTGRAPSGAPCLPCGVPLSRKQRKIAARLRLTPRRLHLCR